MPGLLTLNKNGLSQCTYRLLLKSPSRAKLLKAKPISLIKIKGITIEKANAIQESVMQDSGFGDTVLTELNIKTLTTHIITPDKQIDTLQAQLAKHGANDIADLLVTIQGCGMQSAVAISIGIEDISRFDDAAALCSYFGVHPENHTSGDIVKKPRMSKKGSSSYRATIYMAAKNAIMYCPYIKDIYAQQRAKGKSYNEALGAVMNKLTRIIFGMLKNKEAFIAQKPKAQKTNKPDIDKQIIKLEQNESGLKNELKTMQQAPTSKRKTTKIKKAIEKSQNSIEELRTRSDLSPVANV